MNISSIKYRGKFEQVEKRWRCKHGIGAFQKLLVLCGPSLDLQYLAKAMVFALSGRRQAEIDEVTLDLTDNAGDTWSIWRGSDGSRFMNNGRPIAVEEAQRSMLAALFDMEPGIAQGNGLVAPILYRTIRSKNGMFSSVDTLNGDAEVLGEPDPDTIIQMLVDECVKIVGRADFAKADALAQISSGLTLLQARWQELQSSPVTRPSGSDVAPSIGLIESITRELDHLQQIDFFCRKMTDISETVPRLNSQVEVIEARMVELSSRWSNRALDAGSNSSEWNRGMEYLVRVRAYSRLTETATKLKRVCLEKLKPAAEKSMTQWNQFLSGSQVVGQEVESCLASMLLGMKQLGLDLDRIDSPMETTDAMERKEGGRGWFDRLKGRPDQVEVATQFKMPSHHQDWLGKSVREVEGLKASIEYALKSVQAFSDEFDRTKSGTSRELQVLEDLAQKASDELAKLKESWVAWATDFDVPFELSLEEFVSLARDANELQSLEHARADTQARIVERLDLQKKLEAQVRQWWNIIGSDKSVDITNPAFLVAEARAALRHRDTRRQRVQKLIKEAARFARDESLLQWNYKRRTEIQAQWQQLFVSAGLSPLDIGDERIGSIARLGAAIQSMKQLQTIREAAVATNGDVWDAKSDCAVRLYLWNQTDAGSKDRDKFVEMAKSLQERSDSALKLLLVADEKTAKLLASKGFGGGMMASGEAKVSAARVGAQKDPVASSKPNLPASQAVTKGRKDGAGASSSSSGLNQQHDENQMSRRAAAALKLLNPKSGRT